MKFQNIRRSRWCLGLAGALLTGVPVLLLPRPVQAQTRQQVATTRKTIDAAYKAEDAAFDNFDVEGSLRYRTENFVSITKEGKTLSRKLIEERLAMLFKVAKDIQSSTVIEQFAWKGNRVNVRVKTYSRMVLAGKEKKRQVLAGTERRNDVWIKQGGRWLRTQDKIISSSVTVDGKQMR